MAINTKHQGICVPDACSLLFSAQVELYGKSIFEWILDQYQVFICQEVKTECFQKLQTNEVELDEEQDFKSGISARVAWNADYSECLEYLQWYCKKKEIPEFPHLGEGERNSLALCLLLNAKFQQPIILLTDDYPATKIFEPILNEQKFAIQMAVPDVIINLFKADAKLDENRVKGTLNSYYNVMKNAMRRIVYDERMRLVCRSSWEQECGLRCI